MSFVILTCQTQPSHAATPTQNPEDEVVQVEKALIEGGSSLAQQARRALLGMCTEQAAWRTTDNGTAERSMHAENQADERTSERNTLTYHHFTEEPRLAGTCSSLPQGRHSSQDEPRDRQPVAALKPSGESIPLISAQSQSNLAAEPKGCPSPPRAPMGQGSDRGCGRCIIVAPGKLEHTQRVQAQKQQLVLRRLWSQLEREQVRRTECKKREHLCATRLKDQREAERKMQEDESFAADSDLAELELTEDREKAEQWAALMALEERKHKLTKAKENERFIEALREKVKQRMIQKHSQLPALCSCARTFWETDPDTCANNCIFYKNEKGLLSSAFSILTPTCNHLLAYAKALWNLMVSLELQ